MRELSKLPLEHIFEKTREYWVMWLSKKHVLKMPGIEGYNNLRQELLNAYNRALLMLYLLNDHENGSFVAAPEFDSNFENAEDTDFAGTETLRSWCLPSSIQDIPNIATDFLSGASGPSCLTVHGSRGTGSMEI
jgi:hypothetical protein